MTNDRRLMQDYLPIAAISKEASQEKSVRKGNISTLRRWWAPRSLAACRVAVDGALAPASRLQSANEPSAKLDHEEGEILAARFFEIPAKAVDQAGVSEGGA